MHSREYTRYIRSAAWRRVRLAALERAGGRCARCGRSGVRLYVHHTTYASLGREHAADLVVVCWGCHTLADAERVQQRVRRRPVRRRVRRR